MSKKTNKIDTKFLVFKPNVFVEKRLLKAKRRFMISKFVYISFNVIAFIATFVLLALSTIIFSKIIKTTVPDWYFIVTTGISASVALIVSVANFFYVKDQYEKSAREIDYIEAQIAYFELNLKDYKNNKNKEFTLFHNVCTFIELTGAREAENE